MAALDGCLGWSLSIRSLRDTLGRSQERNEVHCLKRMGFRVSSSSAHLQVQALPCPGFPGIPQEALTAENWQFLEMRGMPLSHGRIHVAYHPGRERTEVARSPVCSDTFRLGLCLCLRGVQIAMLAVCFCSVGGAETCSTFAGGLFFT